MIWIAIALLPFVLYLPVYNGEYIFDDWSMLYEPTCDFVRTGSFARWKYVQGWPLSGFRQLTWLSFVVNRWMAPGEWEKVKNGRFRLACHLTNIGLHSINALLVGDIGGRFAALIFVVHPLAVGAVAYLSARPSVLSATFALLSVTSVTHGHPILAAVFVPLAFLAKEDMAVLPILLAVLAPRYAIVYCLPVVYFAIVRWKQIRALLTASETGAEGWADNGVPSLKGWDYRLTAMLEHLFRVPCWMFGLWLNPDPELTESVPLLALLWSVVVLSAVVAVGSKVTLAMIVFSPILLYMVIPTPDVVMEYRAYFMLAGLSIVLPRFLGFLPFPVEIAILFGWAAYTMLQAWCFATRLGYWAWITRISPTKVRGWSQLYLAYFESGSLYHAEQCATELMRFAPETAFPYQHMAQIREAEGKLVEAHDLLKEGVRRCPRSLQCVYGLGVIQGKTGFKIEALMSYRRALEINPNHSLSYFKIGEILAERDASDAIPFLRRACEIQPEMDAFQQLLALACAVVGEDPGPNCPYRAHKEPIKIQDNGHVGSFSV